MVFLAAFALNDNVIRPKSLVVDNTINLQPGDSVTVNCSTALSRVVTSPMNWRIDCRGVATATHVSPGITPSKTPTSLPNTPSNTPVVTSTKSPNPVATNTPASTATITRTPSTGLTNPFLAAPFCEHDNLKWHGLWDYMDGCWYDHAHGDDPSLADSYFGKFGVLWGGTTISYPFSTGAMENDMKHGGYKISVRTPSYHPYPPCGVDDDTDITGENSDNCVIASRVEYHGVGSLLDLIARVHSYYMEVYTCRPPYRQPQDCGTMQVGGWADYAELKAPHYGTRVVRPGGTIDFGDGMVMTYSVDSPDLPANSGEPYVFSIPYSVEERNQYRNNPPLALPGQSVNATIDQWSMNDWDCEPKPSSDPCHNLNARILFQVGDAFTLVDTQNLNTIRWICYRESNCEYNGSLIGLNEIGVRVFQSWQPNGNGFVTFNGYTDRWGNIVTGCTSVSVDCVPFVLDHSPVGVGASRSDNGCECRVWEYDYYYNPNTGLVNPVAGKPASFWITVNKIKHPN